MHMGLISLGIVFLVILILLALKRPLYQAISGGLVCSAILFQIPLGEIVKCTVNVFTNWTLFSVIVSLYLITYMQKMLDKRNLMKLAEHDLNKLFQSTRKTVLSTAFFFGLLPSAAATIFYGDIVKSATKGYLDDTEQAFVTSWYRHIPESFMPTYSFILLFATLTEVPITEFIACMIVPIIFLFVVGYYPYITKLPKNSKVELEVNRKQVALDLLRHIWPILLILILIIGCGLSVVSAVLISIVATIIAHKFSLGELKELITEAFDTGLLLNSFLCLVLKEFISYANVLELLPDALSVLPIPTYLIFVIMFFLGGLINLSGIIAIGAPLAFSALEGGAPLMMLLMCVCHVASQVSPTHICQILAADYFDISLGTLLRKIMPRTFLFCLFAILYYNLLVLF